MDEASASPCPSCRRSQEWQECDDCGGEGHTPFGLLHELCPLEYDWDETEPCNLCAGGGGWWHCPNNREWCEREGQRRATVAATTEQGG